MPKIPISDGPGLRGYDTANMRMSGAPDYNWRSPTQRALSGLGDAIGGALSALGNFAKVKQAQDEAQDRLLALEADAAVSAMNKDLEQRMADNPGDVEHFPEWEKDHTVGVNEAISPILDRMTEKGRKVYQLRFAMQRDEAEVRRYKISANARATNIKNGFEAQIAACEARGDFDGMDEALSVAQSGPIKVFSDEEEKNYREVVFPNRREVYQVRSGINTGNFEVLDDLEAKDADGRPTHYKTLSDKQRKELLQDGNAAEKAETLRRVTDLHDHLINGEEISDADIKARYEGKNSSADKRMMQAELKTRENYLEKVAQTERARDAKAKKQRDEQLDIEEYNIYQTTFKPGKAGEAERDKMLADIIANHPNDPAAIKRLRLAVENIYKDQTNAADDRLENNDNYIMAKAYVAEFATTGDWTYYEEAGDYSRTEPAQEFVALAQKRMNNYIYQLFLNHPEMKDPGKYDEVKALIDDKRDYIRNQCAADLVAAWQNVEASAGFKGSDNELQNGMLNGRYGKNAEFDTKEAAENAAKAAKEKK